MRPPIDGSVALVTGASSGIGVELARQLAARVSILVLVARRRERLEELAAELRDVHAELNIEVRPCDLTDRAAVASLCNDVLTAHGVVHILVNNAGFGDMGMFDRADWDKTERMIELNVRAPTYLAHRLVPAMVAHGRGGVLNIGSGFGLAFLPGFAGYVATKHFINGLSESMRLDLRAKGVVVTQVCPGPVATEFEAGVGNFTGVSQPGFVEIGAERCARAALRGFERGRARVVPGLVISLLLFFEALTPSFILRLLYVPIAGQLRRRQERALPPVA